MKKIALLLFGCLIAGTTALCQNPLAEVQIFRTWNARKDIPATPNTSYKWKIPGDTAYYFQPIAGKTIEATITFKEVTTQPPPLVLKEVIDNTAGVFKLPDGTPDGTIVNPITNVYSLTTWNSFSQLVSPNPGWCGIFDNSNCSFSYVVNSTATYTFTGKKVEVWGEKTNNKGKIAFKIDNGPETILDLYDPTTINNKQVIFSAEVAQGTHTVTARITADKNPASTSTNLLIDNVKVYE